MDLHSLVLDRRGKSASLRVADAGGERDIELDPAACERVAFAAQPLFDWAHGRGPVSGRTPRDATLVAFSVDALNRRLRLGYIAERSPPSGPPPSGPPPSGPQPSGPPPSGDAAAGSPLPPKSGGRVSQPGEPAALTWTDGDYGTLQALLREAARTALREVRPRKSEPTDLSYDARWEYLYQNGGDGWELARPAPPLARYLLSQLRFTPGQRALVLGAGRGHEALLLGELARTGGASVVAVDIAPSAVQATAQAVAQAGLADVISSLQRDLFVHDESGPLAAGSYDVIVEHCCYCAIDPQRRDEYVAQVARLLRPGGRFIALFYCHNYPGGPPFSASMPEIEERLTPAFAIDHGEVPLDSILTRAAQEWLVDTHLR